jgi:hypothetical protein
MSSPVRHAGRLVDHHLQLSYDESRQWSVPKPPWHVYVQPGWATYTLATRSSSRFQQAPLIRREDIKILYLDTVPCGARERGAPSHMASRSLFSFPAQLSSLNSKVNGTEWNQVGVSISSCQDQSQIQYSQQDRIKKLI